MVRKGDTSEDERKKENKKDSNPIEGVDKEMARVILVWLMLCC